MKKIGASVVMPSHAQCCESLILFFVISNTASVGNISLKISGDFSCCERTMHCVRAL